MNTLISKYTICANVQISNNVFSNNVGRLNSTPTRRSKWDFNSANIGQINSSHHYTPRVDPMFLLEKMNTR